MIRDAFSMDASAHSAYKACPSCSGVTYASYDGSLELMEYGINAWVACTQCGTTYCHVAEHNKILHG